MDTTSTMTSSFPVGSCVVLQNLVGGAQYNDKNGIVKSRLTANGRQEVYVFGVNKSMAIKPINMRYLPRELSSLSVPEMKGVLTASGSSTENELSGLDKESLKSMVAEVSTSAEELAKLIAQANEPAASDIPTPRSNRSATTAPPNISTSQLRQGAERMSSMTPDQLRQQAATMRAMGAATLRATNPAMAALTDEQINMSISQMEAMANNPQMMKMAMDQMKNMNESDLNASVKQDWPAQQSSASSFSTTNSSNNNVDANATYSDVTSAAASAASANRNIPDVSADQFKTASEQMASMSPDQLKQQAAMLRGMSKETLRRTNPFMAKMSDSEIEMAILQMESMASNPDMLKMAGEQLKNMSPEQFEQMKKMAGGAGDGLGAGMMGASAGNNASATATTTADAPVAGLPTTDPSQMMETLLSNPEQLNSMVKMMKQNPDMIKSMLGTQFGGGGDKAKVEQMEKAIDQFAQMDDKQLEKYLKMANTVQTVSKPVLNTFKATKDKLGVSAKTLIVLINIVCAVGVYTFYKWLKSRGGVEESLIDPLAQEMPEIIGGDDEF